MTRVLLRLYLNHDRPLGPGKVQVLESIRDGGSISEAARGMKMSYRSAWLLVDSMNALFRKPVVDTRQGGRGGGAAAADREDLVAEARARLRIEHAFRIALFLELRAMRSGETRIEKDSMGEMAVPKEALYGASTQRAVLNFPVSLSARVLT